MNHEMGPILCTLELAEIFNVLFLCLVPLPQFQLVWTAHSISQKLQVQTLPHQHSRNLAETGLSGIWAWPLGPEPYATSDKLSTLLCAQGELMVHHELPQHNNLPNLEISWTRRA